MANQESQAAVGAILSIEVRDYWHCGGGRGLGQHLDAVCVKDELGLPYLPGRSLRGLMRHALLSYLGMRPLADKNVVSHLFGSDGFIDGLARSDTDPGKLRISSATMSEAFRQRLRARTDHEELSLGLFRVLRMTAIDPARGAAVDKTLRAIEIAIPVTLTARVALLPSQALTTEEWQLLERAVPLIRAIGAHKSRGLGRACCRLSLTPAATRTSYAA